MPIRGAARTGHCGVTETGDCGEGRRGRRTWACLEGEACGAVSEEASEVVECKVWAGGRIWESRGI